MPEPRDKTNTICADDFYRQIDRVGSMLNDLIGCAVLRQGDPVGIDSDLLGFAKILVYRVKARRVSHE
jgi:hypothetical protein